MSTLLILGASSDIAKATSRLFASHGWDLQLAGRDDAFISSLANDLHVRYGHNTVALHFDALQPNAAENLLQSLPILPDAVLCAVGILGKQKVAEGDMEQAEKILQSNFTGLIPVISLLANSFEQRGAGAIMAISSVAGDRGRASNYFYGSAKAGLTAFLSGLRQRLAKKNIQVMTIKPGFVNTSMTAGMNLPPLLTAQPEEVAAAIYEGYLKKKNNIYVKKIWSFIMLIIKVIPESIFKKLNL